MSTIVINALSQLKELEEAMRLDPSYFKDDDIDNCDKLAELLQELENEVKRVEDELEKETIKTNVYRHKMTFLHIDTKKELEENINAARQSNMAVILSLKERLEILTKTIQELQVKDKELTEAITSMESEKKVLEVNHENIIVTLNETMAEKAKAQIRLNETRDILRETNQNIMNIEEAMLILKEQLLKEKAEAREEKARIEEDKYNTTVKATNQEEFNKEKSRELDGVKKRLQESNKELRTVFRENERLDRLNEQLALDIENGTSSLAKEQKELERLALESLRLTALEAQIQQDFVKDKEDIIKKTKETSEKSHCEAENLRNLKETEDKKREELKEIYDIYNELQRYIQSLRKSIDEMKTEIGTKMQEMAEIEVKNRDLYAELGQTQNSHNQVMDSLQREAEEYKEEIQHERELRVKKQQQRDAQLKEIEIFNGTFISFQNMVSDFLNGNKLSQQELLEREASLNEQLEIITREHTQLSENLNIATKLYNEMREEYENKLTSLETSVKETNEKDTKISGEIRELTPDYERVCSAHEVMEKDYDQTKLKFFGTKTQKTKLETNIQSLKEETIEHEVLRETTNQELVVARRESISRIKNQNEELMQLENKILKTGLRFKTIKSENEKFINAIKGYEVEFKELDLLNEIEIDDIERLQDEYEKLHAQLIQGWKEDVEMQEKFTKDDLVLIAKLDDLLKRTNEREGMIGGVKSRLSSGMKIMDEFLGEISHRKEPTETVKNHRIEEETTEELQLQQKQETNESS